MEIKHEIVQNLDTNATAKRIGLSNGVCDSVPGTLEEIIDWKRFINFKAYPCPKQYAMIFLKTVF